MKTWKFHIYSILHFRHPFLFTSKMLTMAGWESFLRIFASSSSPFLSTLHDFLKKFLFSLRNTNSVKLILLPAKSAPNFCLSPKRWDKDAEFFRNQWFKNLFSKLKIWIPLLRLPLSSHFWICKVERSQTHLGQESVPGFINHFFVVVSSQKLPYIQYRIEARWRWWK